MFVYMTGVYVYTGIWYGSKMEFGCYNTLELQIKYNKK